MAGNGLMSNTSNVRFPAFPDHRSLFSREQERELKRLAILSKAAELFDELGVTNTRIEDISDRFGLSKNSVGYYFAGKEEIVSQAYLASHDMLCEAIGTARNAADQSRPALNLLRAWIDLLDATRLNRRPYVCLPFEVGSLPSETASALRGRFRQNLDDIAGLFPLDPSHGSSVMAGMAVIALEWVSRRAFLFPQSDLKAERSAIECLFSRNVDLTSVSAPAARENTSTAPQLDLLFDRDMRARIRREAFLKAGVRLLNTKGYSGLALSDVAEALGVTRGAFYYLFPDKEALLLGCLDRGWLDVESALEPSADQHQGAALSLEASWRQLLYRQMSGTLELIHPRMIDALGQQERAAQTARFESMKSRLAGPVAARMANASANPLPDLRALECLIFRMLFLSGHAFANAAGLEKWPRFQTPSQASAQTARFLNGT